MRRVILLFERPESLKPSKDLFIELRHMYSDYRWRRASGGRDARDPGDDRARAGEMDEADRDGVMREIRAIYMVDDSVLKSFMYEPVEEIGRASCRERVFRTV